ncbi:MAG: SdrD B-like domain-containing protein, partial [Bacteroidota bacterium]
MISVFRDYNGDGVRQAIEPLVPGLTATAYDDANVVAAQDNSSTDGNYVLSIGAGAGTHRVEITGLPSFLQPGAAGTTTVFFASANQTVAVALENPGQFSQNDPRLITTCFIEGPQPGATEEALIRFDYDAGCFDAGVNGNCNDGGMFDTPAPVAIASAGQIGSTFGLAYQKSMESVYVASFMKRHAGFRSNGESGIIYRVQNPLSASPTIVPYIDFDALGIPTQPASGDPHPADGASSILWEEDSGSWDWVGKMSFGDLDISEDEQDLYVVNLFDRRLYRFPAKATPYTAADAGLITAIELPRPCGADVDARPFGLGVYDGLVYFSMVCTGESTTAGWGGGSIPASTPATANTPPAGNRNALSAKVYTYDPVAGTVNNTAVLDFPLNFGRGFAINSGYGTTSARWNPWVTNFTVFNRQPFVEITGPPFNQTITKNSFQDRAYPQPILSDIEFDNGNMVLGFRDRFGDQTGHLQRAPTGFSVNADPDPSIGNPLPRENLFDGVAEGDILRAAGNPASGWTLESGGMSGGVSGTPAGNGSSDGPGGGEFYGQDDYTNFHNEIAQGGLVQVPGEEAVVTIVTDPINDLAEFYDAGVVWYQNSNGARVNNFLVFSTAVDVGDDDGPTFAKANGLGDMAALSNASPIEIGNRVWFDANEDGIQSPDESGINGVLVELFVSDGIGGFTKVAETTTMSSTTQGDGAFFFSNDADGNQTWIVGDRVLPNTDYEIRVSIANVQAQESMASQFTTTDASGVTDNNNKTDLSDSDASDTGVIAFRTGTPGQNNHTLDIGARPATLCELNITSVTPTCAYDNMTGQSTFSVQVDLSWDYANLTTTAEAINVMFNGMTMSTVAQNMVTGTATVTFNNVAGPVYGLSVEATFAAATTCMATSLVDLIACTPDCIDGSGTIGGNVFNDFDNNGADVGANEAGQENVLVEVYDCDGVLVCSTYTNADGNWACDGLNDAEEYRVEFSTPLQPYLQSSFAGTDNGTNTQFVTAPSCEVDYGVVNPADYCQDNPDMAVPCYVNGDPLAAASLVANSDVLVSFDFNSQGEYVDLGFTNETADPLTVDAVASVIGATWGLAYQRSTQQLYASAFVKRHVGIGPLGEGGIYRIDYSGSGPAVVTDWLNVDDIGINTGTVGVGATPAARNSNRGLSTDPAVADSGDPQAFDAVGKTGLGDIDISDDEAFLWVVNLNDGSLNSIEIDSDNDPSTPPTAADVETFAVPNPCDSGVSRPFAVKYDRGLVYVGVVCEELLEATVYTFDGNSFSPVLINDSATIPLDYTKGNSTISGGCNGTNTWFTWFDVLPAPCDPGGLWSYPSPILSDIEIDGDGSLILGFMDRMGHQMGAQNTLPDGSALENYHAGGDILRVCNVAGSYFMQGSVGGCPNLSNNNEGPNGGEFYFQDHYNITTGQGGVGGVIHAETSVGGLALHRACNEIAVSSFDPFNNHFVSGGINWFNNTTGLARDPGYLIYLGETTGGLSLGNGAFGKANGLGDIELFCDELPIQIGNYVWIDEDEDGVQDACEPPLEGVTVKLYRKPSAGGDPIQIASTLTDANGNYYFSSTSATDPNLNWTGTDIDTAVVADSTYFIAFCGDGTFNDTDNTIEVAGTTYCLTTANTGEGNNPDLNDSDATAQALGSLGTFPAYCTQPGEVDTTNHTFDVGFKPVITCDLEIISVTPTCAYNAADGQSTFTVVVEVGWDFNNLVTTNELINVSFTGMMQTIDPASVVSDTMSVTFNNVSGPAYAQLIETSFATTANCTANAVVDLIACTPDCVDGTGTVGGNVFNDFDNNGTDAGASEVGQENVLVEVYDCNGVLVCSTYTNAEGNWTCTGLNDTEEYRVEFSTPLQPYLESSFAGPDNGTNTQFVTAPSCDVDYGVVDPDDYCQENPRMALPCYDIGAASGTNPILVRYNYDFTGGTTVLATFAELGTTWGTSYQRA